MGLVGPNIVTSGLPNAEAMCIGPVSLAMTRAARSNSATSWRRLVFPARLIASGNDAASGTASGPPASTDANPNCWRSGSINAANRSIGHCLVAQFVAGNSTAKGFLDGSNVSM